VFLRLPASSCAFFPCAASRPATRSFFGADFLLSCVSRSVICDVVLPQKKKASVLPIYPLVASPGGTPALRRFSTKGSLQPLDVGSPGSYGDLLPSWFLHCFLLGATGRPCLRSYQPRRSAPLAPTTPSFAPVSLSVDPLFDGPCPPPSRRNGDERSHHSCARRFGPRDALPTATCHSLPHEAVPPRNTLSG